MISHEPFAIICDSYGDLPAELEARYGKGLLSLADVSPELPPAKADRAAG